MIEAVAVQVPYNGAAAPRAHKPIQWTVEEEHQSVVTRLVREVAPHLASTAAGIVRLAEVDPMRKARRDFLFIGVLTRDLR
jgi:hypothetical protein